MNKLRYTVLIASIILMIIQFFMADYNNFFGWKNLLPFISLICMIVAMAGSIIHVNKHGENR
jgi:uncharacterized integral membrane protein